MFVSFEKWQACKNDFVLIWPDHIDSYLELSIQNQTKNICAKDGSSIGADGILLVNGPPEAPEVRILNADGSEANHCGNGVRCVAMAALLRIQQKQKNLPEGLEVKLQKSKILIPAQYLYNQSDRHETDFLRTEVFVSLDLNPPLLEERISWQGDFAKEFSRLLGTFPSLKKAKVCYVDLENPHVVLITDRSDDPAFFSLGAASQKIPPLLGINLTLASEVPGFEGFVGLSKARNLLGAQLSEGLEARTWERGVGPTGACGTAACATAVAHLSSGFSNREHWLAIQMPGGTLYVRQTEEKGPVTLAGPAVLSFTGTLDL